MTLHTCPLIITCVLAAVVEILACKFVPVNVSDVGPVIDVGLTELIYGVILVDQRNVQATAVQTAVLVPTKIPTGIS